MFTAVILTVLAVVVRMFSSAFHVWNFAPIGAVSLFAGSRLPRRWAWIVPVVAMAASDYLLDQNRSRPIFELSRWAIYGTFAAMTLLGPLANLPKFGRWLLPVLSLSGSAIFFIVSNFATWGEGQLYPMTFAGLMTCYAAAIPFYGNTVASELLGTAVLFGLGPIFEHAAERLTRPRPGHVPIEVHAHEPSRPA